jgi:hypothetical protein
MPDVRQQPPRHAKLACAAFLAVAALTGCTSTALHMASGTPTVLAPGQKAVLPDAATLTYVTVAADSRCPPKVQCIRAGDADVVFEHRPAGGDAHRLTLNLPEAPSAPVGAFTLRILALEFGEQPKATVQIDPTPP